jgi:hypothetical protein
MLAADSVQRLRSGSFSDFGIRPSFGLRISGLLVSLPLKRVDFGAALGDRLPGHFFVVMLTDLLYGQFHKNHDAYPRIPCAFPQAAGRFEAGGFFRETGAAPDFHLPCIQRIPRLPFLLPNDSVLP